MKLVIAAWFFYSQVDTTWLKQHRLYTASHIHDSSLNAHLFHIFSGTTSLQFLDTALTTKSSLGGDIAIQAE